MKPASSGVVLTEPGITGLALQIG